jgi:hypothetical protein
MCLVWDREAICRSPQVFNNVFHIQNVNATDSRLKKWITMFHSMATRYLGNYLGWYITIDRGGHPHRESETLLLPNQYLLL